MTPLLLTGSLIGGLWFVHRANQTYDSIRTCRYRELSRLQAQADSYSFGYGAVGVASLVIPGGVAVTTVVFAYALYRRFK
jgi:hypothetical protein